HSPAARHGQSRARLYGGRHSCPATVDYEFLSTAHARIVGSKKEHHAREIDRHDAAFQHLGTLELLFALLIEPELQLALGHDPAWKDGVDANIGGAELTRHAAGEAMNRRFCRDIGGQPGRGALPADRAEMDASAA